MEAQHGSTQHARDRRVCASRSPVSRPSTTSASACSTGEILGLIGPNGSGKTTLINVVTGLLPATSGTVRVDGVETTGKPPHRVARAGIARTFQTIRLFGELTVLENVEVAAVSVGQSRREAVHDRRRAARRDGARRVGGPAGERDPLRPPAQARDCPRARHGAQVPAARRAGRRAQRGGERRCCSMLLRRFPERKQRRACWSSTTTCG